MLSGNFCGSKSRHWIFGGLNFGPGIFWGFVWSPKDFWGVWFLPSFDNLCHLKFPFPQGFCDRYYSNQVGCLKPFRNHLFPRPSIVITGFIIAHVQYIKILTWPRGFLVIFRHLVLFSLCSSLSWELRDNGVAKNLQFWPYSLGVINLVPRVLFLGFGARERRPGDEVTESC